MITHIAQRFMELAYWTKVEICCRLFIAIILIYIMIKLFGILRELERDIKQRQKILKTRHGRHRQ